MIRESKIGERPVLILREPKPLPPEGHKCAVYHGCKADKVDREVILQCDCGKRYKCRASMLLENEYVWVRRLLPWPPKQEFDS